MSGIEAQEITSSIQRISPTQGMVMTSGRNHPISVTKSQ